MPNLRRLLLESVEWGTGGAAGVCPGLFAQQRLQGL